MAKEQDMNLYNAKKNTALQILSLPDISLLNNLGLNKNRQVTVQTRYAFGGPVLLRVQNDFSIAIGKDVAEQIAVKEVAI